MIFKPVAAGILTRALTFEIIVWNNQKKKFQNIKWKKISCHYIARYNPCFVRVAHATELLQHLLVRSSWDVITADDERVHLSFLLFLQFTAKCKNVWWSSSCFIISFLLFLQIREKESLLLVAYLLTWSNIAPKFFLEFNFIFLKKKNLQ